MSFSSFVSDPVPFYLPKQDFLSCSLQADSEAVNGAAYAVSRSGPTCGLKSQAASSHMCSMP